MPNRKENHTLNMSNKNRQKLVPDIGNVHQKSPATPNNESNERAVDAAIKVAIELNKEAIKELAKY